MPVGMSHFGKQHAALNRRKDSVVHRFQARDLHEATPCRLVRQSGTVADRTFDITFIDAGVQAFAFTFG